MGKASGPAQPRAAGKASEAPCCFKTGIYEIKRWYGNYWSTRGWGYSC